MPSSVTGTPFPACFKIARTWLSENRDVFIVKISVYFILGNSTYKRYFFLGGLPVQVEDHRGEEG